MNQDYCYAETKMEEAGVDAEYIVGWEGGYVLNPPREEQRVTETYEGVTKTAKKKMLITSANGLNKFQISHAIIINSLKNR